MQTTPEITSRVRVTRGRFAGRTGEVTRHTMIWPDLVYVRLDMTKRERRQKHEQFNIADLEQET